MRDSVTPTASKFEIVLPYKAEPNGRIRPVLLCACVFFDIGRVYVRGQVCVCVPFEWLENRLHFDTSSFEKTENVCSICTRSVKKIK